MKRYTTLDSSIGSRLLLVRSSFGSRSFFDRFSFVLRSVLVHPSFILRSGFVRKSKNNRRWIEEVSEVHQRQNGGNTEIHRNSKGKPLAMLSVECWVLSYLLLRLWELGIRSVVFDCTACQSKNYELFSAEAMLSVECRARLIETLAKARIVFILYIFTKIHVTFTIIYRYATESYASWTITFS